MAPTKFQIYVDQSMRQPVAPVQPPPTTTTVQSDGPAPPKYRPEVLAPNQRFYFDERKLYPPTGEEYSFEELNLVAWIKRQNEILERKRYEQIERENDDLRAKLEAMSQQLIAVTNAYKQLQSAKSNPPDHQSPTRRISVVPQSLQPTQGLEYTDMSVYGALEEAPSVVNEFWKNTFTHDKIAQAQDKNPFAHDKITLPIDQSQYIRENVPTSTPTSKNHDDQKRSNLRRMSRPSMGGSPTLKLSPITETSRDCNSKSSSSSSAMSCTPGTAKKALQPIMEPPKMAEEPDRPLDPNDPTTFRKLLMALSEPLERRSGFFRHNRSLPKIRHGACIQAGDDSYLVDKELSKESKTFTAQLLIDDSNDDSSSMDVPIKTFCIRVDQPANEWLYYVCNELHKRLVRQKSKPDIELSVMIANPAIFYNDGSILIDEYFRFFSLQQFLDACKETSKPFPKSVGPYVALELIQVVRQMHSCGIIHMNIKPHNIIFTCCPNRDDIANVDERTSLIKLIGFERAMDTRLVEQGFKFECQVVDLMTCEMRDKKPWSFEIDWYGTLNCIHQMFFFEDMELTKTNNRWSISKQFSNCCAANVWTSMFDELLNITDITSANCVVDQAVEDLTNWVKANTSAVLKDAAHLDGILEEYCAATNKSLKT